MKLTLRIIGTIAVVLLGIGVILYILMQWGALVEYHAFEWRGIVTAKSPLVQATENLSYFFLSIGLPFGVTAIVLKYGKNSSGVSGQISTSSRPKISSDENSLKALTPLR